MEEPPKLPPDGDMQGAAPAGKKKGKSPKTTSAGYAAILVTVLGFAGMLYKNPDKAFEPTTLATVSAAIASGVGLIQARDDD